MEIRKVYKKFLFIINVNYEQKVISLIRNILTTNRLQTIFFVKLIQKVRQNFFHDSSQHFNWIG